MCVPSSFNKFTNHPVNLNLCDMETGDCLCTQSEVGRVRVPTTHHTFTTKTICLPHTSAAGFGQYPLPAYAKNITDALVLAYWISTKDKILHPGEKAKEQQESLIRITDLVKRVLCIPNSQSSVRNRKPTAQTVKLPRHNPSSPAFN